MFSFKFFKRLTNQFDVFLSFFSQLVSAVVDYNNAYQLKTRMEH